MGCARKYGWLNGIVYWLIVSGCGGSGSDSRNVFHYNEHSGITSLDPAFAKSQATMWPAHQLFNTLVQVDDSLRIIPSLAKSWDMTEDRLTYIFHLRNDV